MKRILFLVSVSVLLSACIQSGIPGTAKLIADGAPLSPGNLLTLADAEKILGEPAYLSDSSTKREKDVVNYLCAYKANAEDIKSKKTGVIYLLFEHYNDVSLAQKRYSFIKTANQDNGIKTLNDLGDEAYFHSDNENFYFIMVRKGAQVFNMKVNKITSHTSLDEFNRVAEKITNSL